MIAWLLILAGFVALVAGAWALVEGAARIAKGLGVSELVIGLTIVAIGTSAPELAVTITAALEGRSDLIIGNVVGSNIANIGLILGVGALVGRIDIPDELLRRDLVWLLGATLAVGLLAVGGEFTRPEGLLLLAGGLAFLVFSYRVARSEMAAGELREPDEIEAAHGPWDYARSGVLVFLGILGLTVGGRWLVSGASTIAIDFGISEYLIGLTVLALGTSLPELATTVVGVRRDQGELILGGVVGSNIFNLLLILAIGIVIEPMSIAAVTRQVQIPLMIGLTLGLGAILLDGSHLRRRWAVALLTAYTVAIGLAIYFDRDL